TSQPVLGSLSQSAKPALQVMLHAPIVQAGVPFTDEQVLAHEPQWLTSLAMLTSQPSFGSPLQSANPASHATTLQTPPPHAGVAWGSMQALPHIPQFFTSVLRLISQPSVTS